MKKSTLAIALLSVSLLLLGIVDLRRGFLLPEQWYLYKSPFIIFSPFHVLLLLSGIVGLKKTAPDLKNLGDKDNKKLLTGLFVLLVLDFVFYRGVAMNRSLQAGKVGLDWLKAFDETGTFKSLYLSLSYLLTVWHATFLSCLLGAWGALAFPYFAKYLKNQSGIRAGFMGTAFSLTQPLCSCCVAITSPSLFKSSLPKSFALSVLIGAPMLNLSTLSLAGSLLPWPFSIVRIAGGLLLTLVLAHVLGRFIIQEEELCDVPGSAPSTENLIIKWFKLSGRIGLWLFPSIILGIVLTSVLWQFWPSDFSNSWLSVATVSILGSLLMISTWSEIPLALQMIGHGLSGPAAAALIALPAVNLGSLLIIGKSSGQWRLAALLGLSVMLISFLVGLIFI